MRPAADGPIDWALIFRAAETRLRMRKWEIARYTLGQLASALEQDSTDPHRGQLGIHSAAQFEELLGLG